jgi:type II restriction enzyme
VVEPKAEVLAKWLKTLFLREQKNASAKGWLLDVMRCVEKLNRPTFSLDQVYSFEDELKAIYPSNRHVREKIRQQLQVLRDKGYLEFVGRGQYRIAPKAN